VHRLLCPSGMPGVSEGVPSFRIGKNRGTLFLSS
jgi:hypothetical protein